MKKTIVKIVSLVLVVCLVCACTTGAFAAKNTKQDMAKGVFSFISSIVKATTDPAYGDNVETTVDTTGDAYEALVNGFVNSVRQNGGAQASTDFVDTAVNLGVNYLKGIFANTGMSFGK